MLKLLGPVCANYGVADPAASHRFATTVLGLEATPDGARTGYDRQSLSFAGGHDAIGIEIAEETDLDELLSQLSFAGLPARLADVDERGARHVHQAVLLEDYSGNAIELLIRPERVARAAMPPRDSGVTALQGFALRSTNVARDTQLWTTLLGARVTDRVGEITYIAFDQLHHRVVLHPACAPGILYTAFATSAPDDIMRNSYNLRERQVRIAQGPGKQAASSQMFLHIEGPERRLYSYVHGTAMLPVLHYARQFARDADSLCAWGSVCESVHELAATL